MHEQGLHCVKSVQMWSYFLSVFSCIQSEYREIRARNNSVFGHFSRSAVIVEYIRLYVIIVGIYCYLEREIFKCLTFYVNNSFYFEMSASLVKEPHLKALKLQKCQGRLLEKIQ